MCAPWPDEIWPWVKVIKHTWVIDNNFFFLLSSQFKSKVKSYDQYSNIGYALWPWPLRYDLGLDTLRSLTNYVKCHPNPIYQYNVIAWTWILVICETLTWGQGHNTPFCHGQNYVVSSQSNYQCKAIAWASILLAWCPRPYEVQRTFFELRKASGTRLQFFLLVHCDLDDRTLGQGNDMPLGH